MISSVLRCLENTKNTLLLSSTPQKDTLTLWLQTSAQLFPDLSVPPADILSKCQANVIFQSRYMALIIYTEMTQDPHQ